MEWWEMQDEIEAQGGAIVYREDGGTLLRLPDGHCLPLCSNYTTEGVVMHAHQVFKQFVGNRTPALLVTPRESRAEQCGSQVRLDGSAGKFDLRFVVSS